MDCIRSRAAGNIENQIAAQIALCRRRRAEAVSFIGVKHMERGAVGVGVDRHCSQPHLAAGANHPQRNLAAVRNQDLLYLPAQAAILPHHLQPAVVVILRRRREDPLLP